MLTGLGVQVGAVRDYIQLVLGRNERVIVRQTIATSRVKEVIEIAFDEAKAMHQV